MKKTILLGGAILLKASILQANNDIRAIMVNDLDQLGIDKTYIIETYKNQHEINLDIWEEIKVSADDEGKTIKFETFDDIIIRIDIKLSAGGINKFLP